MNRLTLFNGKLSLLSLFLILNLIFISSAGAGDRKCWPQEFLRLLSPDGAPLLTGAPPESAGITRRQVAIKGRYEPQLSSDFNKLETEDMIQLEPKSGKTIRYNGVEYIEFPNSTAFRTMGADGKEREYLLTRGVRPYKNIIRKGGTQSPQNYVSDVLLFERAKNGKFRYVKTLLKSAPEKGFLFEDPRISILYGASGKPHFYLSGTDYSSHVPGKTDPDVMNRFVQLQIGRDGSVGEIKVDEFGKPNFSDMSPAPQIGEDGHISYVDAKNGTISRNEKGEIVVRLRLRPDFENPHIKEIAGENHWHYGEQVYVFKDYREFRRYDWKHSLDDLFNPSNEIGSADRVRPRVAKEIIRDTDLIEQFKDSRIVAEKGKGLGPGSIPVRIRRVGDKIYISNGVGAKEDYAGTISKALRETYALKDGEVKFLTPDHEIRYFKSGDNLKRHYTASFKLFNSELTHIDGYYADAIQPITLRERGVTSGIADLQHTYPMGRTIVPGRGKQKAVVRIISGTSDANTSQYDMDIIKVLDEMSEGSAQRLSGQVYNINR